MSSSKATLRSVPNDFTLSVPGCGAALAGGAADITLSAGTVVMQSQAWMQEPLWKGLKLILVLSGRLDCRVEGQPPVEIRGPTLCAVANQGEFCGDHLFASGVPVRYATVQLDFPAIRSVGLEPDRLFRQRHDDGPVLFCRPASRSLLALARQIVTCPLHGPSRAFYLGGKALELTALGLEDLLADQGPANAGMRLNSADLERVQAARELLCRDLQHSPSLAALARQVGLNARKLTEGFRQLFGSSVYAYLQEVRLSEAYRLLASGESNVSSAAYRVGYSPAHFSIAFRKRFGVSPRELR